MKKRPAREPAPSEASAAPSGPRSPREVMAFLAGLAALGCAAAAGYGGHLKWSGPTLAVLFVTGSAECLLAIAFLVWAAFSENKRVLLMVPAVLVSVVAATFFA
ncbi:hypothetical protein HY251_16470, partial [bacterium]|nr:hypothetical protein [bacterium]